MPAETQKYYGFHRSEVVDNKDPDKRGRVRVWIPDLMPEIDRSSGIWARPGNNPVGGRNREGNSDHHYSGTSYIPLKGSWVWIFFESGNPNRPYYFGAVDIENTEVLPENQKGKNYELKWTIFKSHAGRCIVISDDEDDERVEITSKKRKLKSPPTGDLDSVYEIDGNQTTILLDERNGKEKVLIRTHKGDFLHIDIDEQQLHAYFKSDIHLLTDSKLYISSKDDMHLKTEKGLFLESTDDTNIKSSKNLNIESKLNMDIKTGLNLNIESKIALNIKSGLNLNLEGNISIDIKSLGLMNINGTTAVNILTMGILNTDCSIKSDQMKIAIPGVPAAPAAPAINAIKANPKGERNT